MHNLPMFQIGRDDLAVENLRPSLDGFERKYNCASQFTQLPDLDDESFKRTYGRKAWAWPEPEKCVA